MIELINKKKNVNLTGASGNVEFKQIGGGSGGYYIPSVDEEGFLNWEATKNNMPEVEPVKIKGEDAEIPTFVSGEVTLVENDKDIKITAIQDDEAKEITFNFELPKGVRVGEASLSTPTGETFNDYKYNTAIGKYAHAEGKSTSASKLASHAEGNNTNASGDYSHVEGNSSETKGSSAHAEGYSTLGYGLAAHAEGYQTTAHAEASHSEGKRTFAGGEGAHAEGYSDNEVSDLLVNIDGYKTYTTEQILKAWNSNDFSIAYNVAAHCEGKNTLALGVGAHSEGMRTIATGSYAHAEGHYNFSGGFASHTEGNLTEANGTAAHAEGKFTIASGENQHVQGIYNIEDTENKYAHIVGNGTSTERSNAHTIDWNGNGWFAGTVTIGADNKEVATKEDLENITMGEIDLTDYVTKEELNTEIDKIKEAGGLDLDIKPENEGNFLMIQGGAIAMVAIPNITKEVF